MGKKYSWGMYRYLSVLVSSIILVMLWQAARASSDNVVYMIDFSRESHKDAVSWLKSQGFQFKLDADDLRLSLAGQYLTLEAKDEVAGLIVKQLNLPKTKRIRIHWGVERYPKGADWEKGIYRLPLAVMVSFGDEKIDSGAFFLPDAPYFIGVFLGEKESQGKAYTGNYYKEGGRYFCMPCGVPEGQSVITEFDLEKAYTSQFKKTEMPGISSFGLQMNTKDTRGGARAFIKKIEFLSS